MHIYIYIISIYLYSYHVIWYGWIGVYSPLLLVMLKNHGGSDFLYL